MVDLGETDHGEAVRINRRAAESDLLIYVNINFVPDGRRPQVGRPSGCATTRACARTTTRRPSATPTATWTRARSALTPHGRAHGQARRRAPERLPHRDRAQQPDVRRRRSDFLGKNEDEFTEFDRLKFEAMRCDARRSCRAPRKRKLFHAHPRRLRADRRATPARPSRCTRSIAREELRAVRGPGRGPERHPDLRRARTSRPTT